MFFAGLFKFIPALFAGVILFTGCPPKQSVVIAPLESKLKVVENPEYPGWKLIDLSPGGNADYHHNLFVPYRAVDEGEKAVTNHYPNLSPGTYLWKSTPFMIAPLYEKGGKWPLINSGVEEGLAFYRFEPIKVGRLQMAVAGGRVYDPNESYICDIILRYADGEVVGKRVLSGKDVWDYWQNLDKIPADKIIYDGGSDWTEDVLSLIEFELDLNRQLIGFDILDNPEVDGVLVIFAISGK